MRQRGAVRVVPRTPVTVAIQNGGVPYAYGVVADISEIGACICTDAAIEQGASLSLRLSFPRRSQPLAAEGVVAWCGPIEGGYQRYGVSFRDRTPTRLDRLRTVIASA